MQVCIVIPCYNEAIRLDTQNVFNYFKDKHDFSIHFCFVNDGSSDNTLKILNTIKHHCIENISIVDLENNKGKAEAVRQGILMMYNKSIFDYIGYWDADFATPLEEIDNMMKIFKQYPSYIGILGMRLARLGAHIKRKKLRHYIGRIFATIASSMLNIPLYDSQCGAKIFHARIIPIAFSKPFVSKWLFDVEILFRIKIYIKSVYKSTTSSNLLKSPLIEEVLYEMPLMSWQDIRGSKIKWYFWGVVPFHLWRIFFKYK